MLHMLGLEDVLCMWGGTTGAGQEGGMIFYSRVNHNKRGPFPTPAPCHSHTHH